MTQSAQEYSLPIGNCSGFYGDNLGAAKQLVESGEIDGGYLTGDFLAELTMKMLKDRQAKGKPGYASTFLIQLKQVAQECKARGIKIVVNAGGLEPEGMAEAAEKILETLNVDMKVAYIEGDNLESRIDELRDAGEPLNHMDKGTPLADALNEGAEVETANAYLGGWGIKEALDRGADIVICPRVTDAALVIGPAAAHFDWKRDSYDELAGALAAGHIIECGTQATGGNYSGSLTEKIDFENMGYPIAEMHADGSFVVKKPAGTGGKISVNTITSQLVYEVNGPEYFNPDVILHLDTIQLEQDGEDRVRVSGCRGSAPTNTHKVCLNVRGPFRAVVQAGLVGMDTREKASLFLDQLCSRLNPENYTRMTDELLPPQGDYQFLRVTAESYDRGAAIKVWQTGNELLLQTYPGCFLRDAAVAPSRITNHWPALVGSENIVERVHVDGQMIETQPTTQLSSFRPHTHIVKPVVVPNIQVGGGTMDTPLGKLFNTRSGDKGGNANLGIYASTEEAHQWLHHELTIEMLRELLPNMLNGLTIERHAFPNLRAVNFVIKGLLEDGVASGTGVDTQGKAVGELLRAKQITVPLSLVPSLAQ